MKRILAFFMSVLMLLGTCMTVFADDGRRAYTVDAYDTGTVSISYQDRTDGETPVVGAEFTFYKVGEFTSMNNGNAGTTYSSVIPGFTFEEEEADAELDFGLSDDPEKITALVHDYYPNGSDYVAATNSAGELTITLPTAVYLVEETKSAEGYTASVSFLISVPMMEDGMWNFDVTAEPKAIPLGDLTVSKTVKGTNGETDREFHFTTELASGDTVADAIPAYTETIVDKAVEDSAFTYVKSDGTTGEFHTGDVITLKSGQTFTIKDVPVGTAFIVTEKEAGADGYTTTTVNSQGHIEKGEQTASFTNTRNKTTVGRKSTSDTNDLYIYGIIILILLILAIVFFVFSKKKKKK